MKYIKIVKICVWLCPIILFLFLFSRYFVFSGVLSFEYSMKKDSPYITLEPSGRISDPFRDSQGRWYRQALADPIYFDVRTPICFDTASITLTYSNAGQPLVEFGGMVDSNTQSMKLFALENKLIDDLDWDKQRKDNFVLLQREKKYESIDAFLAHLPEKKDVLTYRYNLGYVYDIFSPLVDIESSDKKYIIATYPINEIKDDFLKQNTIIFNTKELQYGYHKYRFILSVPGIDHSKNFRLYNVKYSFFREPLTYRNFFQKAVSYVRNRF